MDGAGNQTTGYPLMDRVHDTLAVARDEWLTVSLKTLARQLHAHRSSVRRWLLVGGIHPIIPADGRKRAIRYHWPLSRPDVTWPRTRRHGYRGADARRRSTRGLVSTSRSGLYGVSPKALGAASCLQYCEMEGTTYAREFSKAAA